MVARRFRASLIYSLSLRSASRTELRLGSTLSVGQAGHPSTGTETSLWLRYARQLKPILIGRNIMDHQLLTTFFMWCTILNGGMLLLWTAFCTLAPDLVFRTQSKWFPLSRETYNVVIYCFLGLFKIIFLVFNVVPLIALLIIGN